MKIFDVNQNVVDVAKNILEKKAAVPTHEEQLDELKKSTLASYIGGASADKSALAHDIGKINQNAATIGTSAAERLERDKLSKKHGLRSLGINRAANKLAKEDVDLSEADLSKIDTKTLQSLVQLQSHFGKKDERTRKSAEAGQAELKRRMIAKEEAEVTEANTPDQVRQKLRHHADSATELDIKKIQGNSSDKDDRRQKQHLKAVQAGLRVLNKEETDLVSLIINKYNNK